jgi:hypothetical protein
MKEKNKLRRIRTAFVNDGISSGLSYITGLPIPIGLITMILKIIKETSPQNYVDWKLEKWPLIYKNEIGKCVKVPFKGKDWLLPQVLVFNNSEENKKLSEIEFNFSNKSFILCDEVRALTEIPYKKLLKLLRKKRRFSNEQNLRLNKISKKGNNIILNVQPVDYKLFVHTNLVLDVKLKNKKQTLRELLHSDGKLEQLNNSLLANHLGIGILLFTADGSIIIQKRSKKVAFRTNELCPTASGAISSTDLPTNLSLENMEIFRESFEEIGINKSDIIFDKTKFLGITRELIRAGKPEMFFIAKTKLSENEIKDKWRDAKDRWESKKIIFFNFGELAFKKLCSQNEMHEFLSKIDSFINQYSEQSSIPLLTVIALWTQEKMFCYKSGN